MFPFHHDVARQAAQTQLRQPWPQQTHDHQDNTEGDEQPGERHQADKSGYGLDAFRGPQQQHIRRAGGKQAVGDHADDVVQGLLHLHRIHDLQAMHVEDDVAVVGNKVFAVHRLTAELDQFPRHVGARHGNHLDGQGKGTEHIHQLGFVGDTDELPRHGGDDLLPRQRTTAALDQVQVFGGFIGAVDVDGDVVHHVEIFHRDAVAAQALGAGLGTGHGGLDLALDLGQLVNEKVGRAAGADTDGHTRLDVVDGGTSHRFFHLVLIHVPVLEGRCGKISRIIAQPGRPVPDRISASCYFTPMADHHPQLPLRDYVEKIRQARVYDVAKETPLEPAPGLSARLGNDVLLKREDLQPVFSFKLRGAYNKITTLDVEQRAKGVIAASAGNHAQGVALAAQRLGLQAVIVMPKTTPEIKVLAVKQLGAEVILHGNAFDDAYEQARKLVAERGMTYIPPYDDPEVIAGQGTVAMEILQQHPEPLHAIFVPVGGGGLIAGVAAYAKQLHPQLRIIGVEPDDAPCMHHALAAGERIILDQVGLFADGVAVRQAGEEPFRIARELVDEVILVSTDEICAAIKDIFDDTRSITEPAGALAVAGLKKYVAREGIREQTLVAIDSGANMNFDRLRHVAERAELGERREALLSVTIPEKPGSFRRFCDTIGLRGITEFNYRYADPAEAHVFVGVHMHGGDADKDALIHSLEAKNYAVLDMTDNEMAKLHIRYMVGGHSNCGGVENERLLRFEFPERPGALLRFLNHIGERWNISLFHYRNHGAAFGRVLTGIQVPLQDNADFQTFLDELGYESWEETDNPAYKLFLR